MPAAMKGIVNSFFTFFGFDVIGLKSKTFFNPLFVLLHCLPFHFYFDADKPTGVLEALRA